MPISCKITAAYRLHPPALPSHSASSSLPPPHTHSTTPRLSKDIAPQVSLVLGKGGELLDYFEYPLTLLRRASIPLLDAESYHRPWFLASLLLCPLAALLYLDSKEYITLSPMIMVTGVCVGVLLATGATLLTRGLDNDTPPTWDFGTGFPIGAALVACVSLTLASMWVDTIASELVRVCALLCAVVDACFSCSALWTHAGLLIACNL